MDYIIETENLTKRYGTATVVDKVNLHVPKGKIYGLLGRNGAGKTTAMKMMLQLAFPTEGTVRLFGTNYKENIHTLYSKVGSIIETPGFYSNLTGYENLQILAKLRGGVSKSERISTIPMGSSPLIGSSSIKSSGSCIMAAAIPSRCFIPRE